MKGMSTKGRSMPISEEEYRSLLEHQRMGRLQIFISTADFRQLFLKIDGAKLSQELGEPIHARITFINILSYTDFLALVVSIALAVPAFGWWSLLVIPSLIIAWMFYKAHASRGKQRLLGVSVLLAVVIGSALFWDSLAIWTRLFIVAVAVTIFLIRLLYYAVARTAFGLVHSSYKFFDMFYLKPEGALVPFIWTEPPLVEESGREKLNGVNNQSEI
jgi:hypothetical protein